MAMKCLVQGKIFHERFYDSASWVDHSTRALMETPFVVRQKFNLTDTNGIGVFDWHALQTEDSAMADYKIAEAGYRLSEQKT